MSNILVVPVHPIPVAHHHTSTSSYYECKDGEYIVKINTERSIKELEVKCSKTRQEAERKHFCEITANRNYCSHWELYGELYAVGFFVLMLLLMIWGIFKN